MNFALRALAFGAALASISGAPVPGHAAPGNAATGVLHSFPSAPDDGVEPRGSLTVVDTQLWGRTAGSKRHGHPFSAATQALDNGIVFSFAPGGGAYHVEHVFAGSPDGRDPRHGSLTLAGGLLYGTTVEGGLANHGSIYALDPKSGAFTVVYSFTGATDGAQPHNGFSFDPRHPNVLYGTSGDAGGERYGDHTSYGTIFAFDTATKTLQTLHRYDDRAQGAQPHGAPVLDAAAGRLYGMTRNGGAQDAGTIFSLDVNGSGYRVLHEFAGGSRDGAISQHGDVIALGDRLFGMTTYGGGQTGRGNGVIFSLGKDGTDYRIVHRFAGPPTEGRNPFGSLSVRGGRLYGTTSRGGRYDLGTIFALEPSGRGYTTLHDFAGGRNDGGRPIDNAVPDGNALYVLTTTGGAHDRGVIFAQRIDG